jgi:perosamine synthetase
VKNIPVAGPSITQKEIDYVTDAVTNAWYGNANMYHERFERAFADYIGRRFAMALPSCTAAIHLALLAMNVGPGDEVIVPDITWIATAAPITYVGATPVFADIDPKTWCLAPESFRERITQRTKAVIPVDLYGNVANHPAIEAIAAKHGIAVIEDAAEAVGGERNGRRAGAFGQFGVFSFHGSKTLTTGEGGMLVADDEQLLRRVQVLRDHGRTPGDTNFFNREIGQKYKMSSMQAALGLAQLERIEELIDRKRELFSWYEEELGDLDLVRLNFEDPGTRSTYWMVTIVLDPSCAINKEALRDQFAAKGIQTRPFFHPLSSLPAYASLGADNDNPVSYAISPTGINLPSALNLTREDVQYVCSILREILTGSRYP